MRPSGSGEKGGAADDADERDEVLVAESERTCTLRALAGFEAVEGGREGGGGRGRAGAVADGLTVRAEEEKEDMVGERLAAPGVMLVWSGKACSDGERSGGGD